MASTRRLNIDEKPIGDTYRGGMSSLAAYASTPWQHFGNVHTVQCVQCL